MRIQCESLTKQMPKSDLLCVLICEDGFADPAVKQTDALLGGYISALKSGGHFKGKQLAQLSYYPQAVAAYNEVLFIGLGKKRMATPELLRRAGGLIGGRSTSASIRSAVVVSPDLSNSPVSPEFAVRALAEGVKLGNYYLDTFKSGTRKRSPLDSLKILIATRSNLLRFNSEAELGLIVAKMQCKARDFSAYPASIMTPSFLAREARRLGKETGLKVSISGRAGIERLKMGAFLAVARGSTEEPKFITMEYLPTGRPRKRACLVGKGVTFDTGGLSLKTPDKMLEMKQDMTGAAVTIATMAAIARLKPNIAVTAFVPSSENMPDAKAFKPGDIVTTCIGKTIEVLSTDAEGRLLLADALGYASKQKPDFLLDVATLTGATRYALGHVAAPYLTTSDTLASKFEEASRVSGEKVWRLPLWDEYRKQIDSDLADMKNTGGAAAGTITAAMLLKEFTAGIPWLHLDIAAMDMQYEASEYIPRGASGFGVRVLTELLCNL